MAIVHEIGAANSDGVDERVAFVERNWTRLRGSRKFKPAFWHDVEVRRFLIAEHGFLTFDMAVAQVAIVWCIAIFMAMEPVARDRHSSGLYN